MGKYQDNPWLGLESYQENQIIYGRNAEIEELSQCVLNNRETVLYGKSGIGKSSIINAGILPIARKNGFIPVVVRLDHSCKTSYIKQIDNQIRENVRTIPNDIERDINELLMWEYFHTRKFVSKSDNKARSKILIIFDQFEEIFTLLDNPSLKNKFFSETGDVLNDVMPKSLLGVAETSKAKTLLAEKEVVGFDFLDNLVFDSKEHNGDSSESYVFDNEIHFLFTIREDFLSEFEYFTTRTPSLKQHRYALRPLNEEQAADIILKPRPDLVNDDVARLIIENVTNRTDFTLGDEPEIDVDAAVLSLFLNQIYDKRESDSDKITGELVGTFGKDILKDFYAEAIKGLSESQIRFIENELLTGDYRRDSLSKSDFKAGGFSETELNKLIDDKKLLRQFYYGGILRIELIHDVLCPIVFDHRLNVESIALKKKDQEIIRRNNQQKIQNNLNPLTFLGRKPTNNTYDFGEFSLSYYFKDSCEGCDTILGCSDGICFYAFKYLLQENNHTLDGANSPFSSIKNGEEMSTIIEYRDSANEIIKSMDYIDKIRLIKSLNSIKVDFLKDDDTPFYIKGYCGIKALYNDNGNEIERTYLNSKGQPIRTIDGYAIVKRDYDSYGNIQLTTYYNEYDKPCRHRNGNHGFISNYDELGNEIRRLYIDELKESVTLTSGISGYQLKYDELGRIIQVSCIDKEGVPIKDKFGYCAVSFEYDEENRVSREMYLDVDGEPMLSPDGYCITETTYRVDNSANTILLEKYKGIDNQPVLHKNNYAYCKTVLTPTFLFVETQLLDSEMNLTSGLNEMSSMIVHWDEYGLPDRIRCMKKNRDSLLPLSHKWVKLDEYNRYIYQIGEIKETVGNIEVIEKNDKGGYGIEYERDEYTLLPTAIYNISQTGQRIISPSGVFKQKIEIIKGQKVKEFNFSKKGLPQKDSNGVYGYHYLFDNNDVNIGTIFLGEDGKEVEDNYGVSRLSVKRDHWGRETEIACFNSSNEPTTNADGVHIFRFLYNENHKTTIYCDVNGNICDDKDGCALQESFTDAKGRVILVYYLKSDKRTLVPIFNGAHKKQIIFDDTNRIEKIRYLDANGTLTQTTDGTAESIKCYDKNGRIIKEIRLDTEGNPIIDGVGDYGTAFSYSTDNKIKHITSLDELGNPHINNQGFCVSKRIYDEQDREIELTYYDEKGNPVKKDDGSWGIRTIYRNNSKIVINLNKKSQPEPLNDTYCAVEQILDDCGRISEEHYLDNNLQPTTNLLGIYGRRYQYNNDGKDSRVFNIDYEGDICADINGKAITVYDYYEDGNLKSERWFGWRDTILAYRNENGISGYQFLRINENTDGIAFLDENGMFICSIDGCAKRIQQRDELGRVILQYWLNENDEPVEDEDSDCGVSIKYNDDGSEEITSLDCDLCPHTNKLGYVTRIEKKDSEGRQTLIILRDENNMPIQLPNGGYGLRTEYIGSKEREISLNEEQEISINSEGWAIREITRKSEGVVQIMWFDENEAPIADNDGDYGFLRQTGENNVEIVVSLNAYGNPHNNKNGFCYRYINKDEKGRDVGIEFYDENRMPIRPFGDDNPHKILIQYDDEENTKTTFCLDENLELAMCKDGWAKKVESFDSDGRVCKVATFDTEGAPHSDIDGDFAYSIIYNDEDNSQIYESLGADGKPHNNKSGYSKRKVIKDDTDRIVYESWRDANNNPWCDEFGNYGVFIEYIDGNTEIRTFLDINDKPFVKSQGKYAALKRTRDEMGRLIKEIRLDLNHKPVMDEDGICGVEIEYGDNYKFITNLNAEEQPCYNKSGYVTRAIQEDKEGRLLFEAYLGDQKNILVDRLGDSATRYVYTDAPDIRIFVSLNSDLEPHNNNMGYAREVRILGQNDEIIGRSFYTLEGKQVYPYNKFKNVLCKWFGF